MEKTQTIKIRNLKNYHSTYDSYYFKKYGSINGLKKELKRISEKNDKIPQKIKKHHKK
jgi:hypothetical protein